MDIAAEETPAIALVLQALQQYRVNEFGKQVALRRSEDASVVLSSELRSLSLGPQDGVLVISARSHLAAGSPLHSLLQSQDLDFRRIALFGTRSWSDDHAFARRVQVYSMMEISREGLQETTDAVMSYVRTWERFHIVLDLDVIDPVFVPGLTTPAPGGLTAREIIYVVQRLALIKSLASVTMLVDAAPDPATSRLAAHIIAELA